MVSKAVSPPEGKRQNLYEQIPDFARVVDVKGQQKASLLFRKVDDASESYMGCTVEFPDGEKATLTPFNAYVASLKPSQFTDNDHMDTEMSNQDRYIDARLAGIENKLDARLESMQRFQEQAESRFQRATERHETDIALSKQQIQQEFRDARKHATNTAWATVGGIFAVFAIITGIFAYWISDQGSYAKSYGDAQVELKRAEAERSEFRESVKAIQVQQQAILDRLPIDDPPAQ